MRDYDIESDLKQEKFQSLKLVQGDRGNKIKINVYEDGQPVNLAGCSVTAKYKRADGEVVDGIVENKTDNYFYAVMDNNITKVAGTLKMLFNIENGDVKVSTFLLLADVREGIGENTGSSGGDTEVTVDLKDYQKKTDNGLETKNKYIVGAINEVNSQCKDIVNGQIPKDYLESCVDNFISKNNAGLSTKKDDDFLRESIILCYEEGLIKNQLELEFERGTIGGDGNNGTGYEYIARLKLKTIFEDNTTLYVADNFRYKLHKYDKTTDAWISSTGWLTSPTKINSDFKYRITVSKINFSLDYVLTDEEINEYSKKIFSIIKLEKKNEEIKDDFKIFKVMSWNIAHFGNGKSSEPSGTTENLAKYRNIISKFDSDILMICEDDPYYNGTNKSVDLIYPLYRYKQQGTKKAYMCNSIYSDYKLTDKKEINYNSKVQETYFTHSSVVINDKVINVISTQLDWYDITIRHNQINQLIDYCKDMEYVIIAGDFNTSCRVNGQYPDGKETGNYKEDYKIFTDAGYFCANDGYFGMFGTVNIGLPWDNIIFKNLTLKSVNVIDDNLSDHKPIVASFLV